MTIPSVPNAKLLHPSGDISDVWRIFFVQLINNLQTNLSREQYLLPQQSQSDVGVLSNSDSKGGILLNNESESGMINTDGTYKNLNTYEELTTAEINAIPAGKRNGRFFLDTTSGELKVGFGDQIKTVTTT